jgi:acyl-CoA thioester hydrolase
MSSFTLQLTVTEKDIDDLGHANNVVYLRWVQEAAAAHWHVLADELLRKKHAWVVLRHEIDYRAPAFKGDLLTVTTWVGETQGARSIRHVTIHNIKGRMLAEARTTWCLIDPSSGRPARIDEDIYQVLARGMNN